MIIAMIKGMTRTIGERCSVPGCNAPHWGRGFCRTHHSRWRRYGSPTAGRLAKGRKLDWLREHAGYQADDCLLWPYANGSQGYGKVIFNGIETSATRAMCELAHGPAPSSMHDAAHSCGQSKCRNPRHLRWATKIENNFDKIAHGTDNRGEKHSMAKLTESDIQFIRASDGVLTNTFLAKMFDVTKGAIGHIRHRRLWGWLAQSNRPAPLSIQSSVTAWEPAPDELERLNKGAPVHLRILGTQHPPVMLMVGEVPE